MVQISTSRNLIGITIIFGVLFFTLNSISNLISDFNMGSFIFVILVIIGTYVVLRRFIFLEPLIPEFILRMVKK